MHPLLAELYVRQHQTDLQRLAERSRAAEACARHTRIEVMRASRERLGWLLIDCGLHLVAAVSQPAARSKKVVPNYRH